MDTWEVQGRLLMIIIRKPCSECDESCEGHYLEVDMHDSVEAVDLVGALKRASEITATNLLLEEHVIWADEVAYVGPAPTAINVSEIARDRAALAAWNMGLPIPGGPPILWGGSE